MAKVIILDYNAWWSHYFEDGLTVINKPGECPDHVVLSNLTSLTEINTWLIRVRTGEIVVEPGVVVLLGINRESGDNGVPEIWGRNVCNMLKEKGIPTVVCGSDISEDEPYGDRSVPKINARGEVCLRFWDSLTTAIEGLSPQGEVEAKG